MALAATADWISWVQANATFGADTLTIRAAFGAALAGLLLALSIADLRRMLLPDRLNLLLAGAGIGQSVVRGQPDLIDAAVGAAVGGGLMMLVAALFRRARGIEGLGFGDQKFVAAAGLWIGWQGLPLMLLVGSVSALVFVAIRAARQGKLDLKAQLPFGPFLGAGTLVAWLVMVSA